MISKNRHRFVSEPLMQPVSCLVKVQALYFRTYGLSSYTFSYLKSVAFNNFACLGQIIMPAEMIDNIFIGNTWDFALNSRDNVF